MIQHKTTVFWVLSSWQPSFRISMDTSNRTTDPPCNEFLDLGPGNDSLAVLANCKFSHTVSNSAVAIPHYD